MTATGRARSGATAIGVALAIAGTAFVVSRLADDREAVADALGDARLVWLLPGAALAAAGMVLIATRWGDVLAALGTRVGAAAATTWYFSGEIGKYLPGAVWPVIGRSEIARRNGVPGQTAYAGVALSLVLLYLAAASVAIVLLPIGVLDGSTSGWAVAAVALVPLGLAALHPRILLPAIRAGERLLSRQVTVEPPPWPTTVRLVVSYVPAWAAISGATWCAARALTGDASLARVAFATVLSWLAGFLAVPVPGGVGVREAVFVASAGLGGGVAAAAALLARLLFVTIDVTGAVVSSALLARRGRRGGPAASPLASPRSGVVPRDGPGGAR